MWLSSSFLLVSCYFLVSSWIPMAFHWFLIGYLMPSTISYWFPFALPSALKSTLFRNSPHLDPLNLRSLALKTAIKSAWSPPLPSPPKSEFSRFQPLPLPPPPPTFLTAEKCLLSLSLPPALIQICVLSLSPLPSPSSQPSNPHSLTSKSCPHPLNLHWLRFQWHVVINRGGTGAFDFSFGAMGWAPLD